jgi:hypothetical protein
MHATSSVSAEPQQPRSSTRSAPVRGDGPSSGGWTVGWIFRFNAEWNGKSYSTKQVRPMFVEEADEIVVVTVYVYYF